MDGRVIRETPPGYGTDHGPPQDPLAIEAIEGILVRLAARMDDIEQAARAARDHLPAELLPALDEIRLFARQGIGRIEAVREDLDALRS